MYDTGVLEMNTKERKQHDQQSRLLTHNKKLLEEIEIKDRIIQLLVVAGHLDKDRLEQATELAGGL